MAYGSYRRGIVHGLLFGCVAALVISSLADLVEKWAVRRAFDREVLRDAAIKFDFALVASGNYEDLRIETKQDPTPRWIDVGRARWEFKNVGKGMPGPVEVTGVCTAKSGVAQCPVYALTWVRKRLPMAKTAANVE